MLLRIAVRASEAWVMADSAAYSDYCGVQESYIPSNVDLIPNAKQHILGWIDRKKRSKFANHVMESRKRGVADWAALAVWNGRFVEGFWDPIHAANSGRSDSLERAIRSVRHFIESL